MFDCSMHFAGLVAQPTRFDHTASTPPRMDAAAVDAARPDSALSLDSAVDAAQNSILSRDPERLQAGIGNLVRHMAIAPDNVPHLDKVSILLLDP